MAFRQPYQIGSKSFPLALLVSLNAGRLHHLIYTLFFVVVRTGLDLGRVRTLRQQEDFSPIPRLDTVNKSLRD